MIKVDKGMVDIEGPTSALMAEASCGMAAVCENVSKGDAEFMAATLYATVMGVFRILKGRGYEIDAKFLGEEIAKGIRD